MVQPILSDAFEIIDISPTLCPKTATYPMDTPFSRKIDLSFERGDNLLLSSINTSLHVGAHADAPNHYHSKGAGIDARSLHYYIGPVQVIHTPTQNGRRLTPQDIAKKDVRAPRVLFRTDSFPDPMRWQDEFSSLSPELIDTLHAKKVCLIGIDTPSVDPSASKHLESHQKIFACDMAILENLVLSHVPEGIYTLVALPLKIGDADASPVRAILLKN